MALSTNLIHVVKACSPGRVASGLFGVLKDDGDIGGLDTIISAFRYEIGGFDSESLNIDFDRVNASRFREGLKEPNQMPGMRLPHF